MIVMIRSSRMEERCYQTENALLGSWREDDGALLRLTCIVRNGKERRHSHLTDEGLTVAKFEDVDGE